MTHWKPLNYKDIEELKFWFEKPKSLLDIFRSTRIVFFWIYLNPISSIQLVHFIISPSWLEFLGLIAARFLEEALHEGAKHKQSLDSIEDLFSYLSDEIVDKFGLEERCLDEYIGGDKIDEMRKVRPLTSEEAFPICRVFVRKSVEESVISGQKKGFVIPFAYFRDNNFLRRSALSRRSMSMIFIDDPPEQISNCGKYFLFHEVGHTTEAAWRIKCRSHLALTMVSGVLMWTSLNTGEHTLLSFSVYAYAIIRLFYDLNYLTNELDDEITADTFSITRLPEDVLDKSRSKVSLEKVLEKNFLSSRTQREIVDLFDITPITILKDSFRASKILSDRQYTTRTKLKKDVFVKLKKGIIPLLKLGAKNVTQFNNVIRLMYIKDAIHLRMLIKEIVEENNDELTSLYFRALLHCFYYQRRESRWFIRVLEAVLLIPVILSTSSISWFSILGVGAIILSLRLIWIPLMISSIAQKTSLVEASVRRSLVSEVSNAV